VALAWFEAKPALLSFEDDEKLICKLREENTQLKKKVKFIIMSCFLMI